MLRTEGMYQRGPGVLKQAFLLLYSSRATLIPNPKFSGGSTPLCERHTHQRSPVPGQGLPLTMGLASKSSTPKVLFARLKAIHTLLTLLNNYTGNAN